MKLNKIITCVFLIIIILTGFVSTSFAEYEGEVLSEVYRDPNGRTMCAARKGYWKCAPENSINAIKNAEIYGADIIEIDVRSTADGILILMEDETVERTCYGYGENTVVSEMTYDEIKALHLLEGQGGYGAKKTQQTVPTLEEVFTDRNNYYLSSSALNPEQKALFMIDADWSLRDKISNLVIQNKMINEVIFYIDDASPDEITAWKESLSFDPMVMTYFKGNVIFAATANVKIDSEVADCIHLATKNPYGVVFGETVQTKAIESGIRTMATPCIPELCGTQMKDTQAWWDELISSGFSIILTDHVEEFVNYTNSCKRDALKIEWALTEYVTNWTLPDFKTDKFFDYKLAYTNAVEFAQKVNADQSRALSDIHTAVHDLEKAYNDIVLNYEDLADGTAGMTITPVRILLCIAAAAVVIIAEIYVYKKKKK